MGKILKVDLGTGATEEIKLNKKDIETFIGGSGLGAKYFHELVSPGVDPLGEKNVLIFMTGPLTGTKAFSSDRFEVITKSPLTNIYAESDCGGKWGSMLKRSGYDGIIITGVSEKPVYLNITDRSVEIADAKDLWGLDTFDTHNKLKESVDKKAEIACIGPGGENLVRYGVISTGGVHARVAGRAGCGTVMGSKKLKAITVYGNKKVKVFNQKGLIEFNKLHSKAMVDEFRGMKEYGTSGGLAGCEELGDLPIKNFSTRRFSKAENISGRYMAKKILKKKYYCGGCVIGCGRIIEIKDGKYKTKGQIGGPEYETSAMLGSNLGIGDLEAICKFNELCNRYGIDTITTGSVIAMIMECNERGLIPKKDLDDTKLVWGSVDAVIKVIHKIGKQEGIGKLLGKGTRAIAKKLGSYAPEFALHVKGLEIPAHDPRAKISLALGYATSNRGACHLQAFAFDFLGGNTISELGFPEPLDRFEVNKMPEFVMKMQNLMSLADSLKCCKFILFYFGDHVLTRLAQVLELVTGRKMDSDELLLAGERVFNLKRLYNTKCGISRKDDKLPERFLVQKRGEGKYEDFLPPLGKMLDEYYRLRNWDEIGLPERQKIKELGIEEYY